MTSAVIFRPGSSPAIPTYESMGVRTLINCQGTYTILSGSLALPEVVQAMSDATCQYVHMDELMDRVGAWLAERTGAEWGLVTAGCAAALCQVTAACVAGTDPEKMARLPDCTGMKNEVIVQSCHRHVYDHAIRMVGVNMVEVVTLADLEAAISDRTAMFAFLGDAADRGQISLRDMTEIGHRHGIPTLVDAAAERPDVPNRYLQDRADAVAYSGGKCLRGPQATGLVLGRKDLLKAAYLHGAPHHALGRPMKVGKEEIMALLAAVELWLCRDHEAEWKMWEAMLHHIAETIASIPTVRTEIVQPGRSNVAPTLSISWDTTRVPITSREVQRRLAEGTPSIEMPLRGEGLSVMPYMMEPGEEQIVAQRLREILEDAVAHGQIAPSVAPAAVNVAGTWTLRLRFLYGEAVHTVTLEQDGDRLSGRYRGQFSTSDVQGSVHGTEIEMRAALRHEASSVFYAYTGQVDGDTMRGTVDLGEYWTAEWTAERVG